MTFWNDLLPQSARFFYFEEAGYSVIAVSLHETTRRQIPQYRKLYIYRCDNLKTRPKFVLPLLYWETKFHTSLKTNVVDVVVCWFYTRVLYVATLCDLVIGFLLFYPEDECRHFVGNVGTSVPRRMTSHTGGLLSLVKSFVYNQNLTYLHSEQSDPPSPQNTVQNISPVFVPDSHFLLLLWRQGD